MMDKKELNVMQLDTVAGGNWLSEIGDFFEDAADEVGDFFEDAADEVIDVVKDIAEPAAKIYKEAKNA